MSGTHGGPGRPAGRTAQTRMKAAMPKAIDVLIAAALDGDVHAASALLDRVWPVNNRKSTG